MNLASQLVQLAEPITAENACGESLEGTAVLAEIEAHRVFGLRTPAATEPDWRALRAAALLALEKSKDLRLLAHLAAAVMRVDTLAEALQLIALPSTWLARYWEEVFPRVEEDGIIRRNALVAFADRVAIIDPLRRLPLVAETQLGSFSLRDLDVAMGLQPNPEATANGDPQAKPDPKAKPAASMDQINAALSAADPQTLGRLHQLAITALKSLASVEETMCSRGGGSQVVPDLSPLVDVLQHIERVLGPRIPQASADTVVAANSQVTSGVAAGGAVKTRTDVIGALDAVLSYYITQEPGSPVPLMIERAKRLMSMSFLEALADVVPESLEAARTAIGQRMKPAGVQSK